MLMNIKEALREAERKGCTIGCVSTLNMETLCAIVDAAGEPDVPIIIDRAQVYDPLIPIESIDPKMAKYVKQAKIPICVYLDHGSDCSFIVRAIRCGSSSIVYGLGTLPFEESIAKLKEFTKTTHDLSITVEAELGIMTSAEENSHGGNVDRTHESIKRTFTDPQQAAEFAREAGMDVLAVCFGTAHGIYAESPLLDIERMKAIRATMPKETRVVTHGSSGVDEEQVCAMIAVGCSKVNYYSYMVAAVSRHIQEYLDERDGKVFRHEVEKEGYRFMKEYAKEVLTVFKNGK